MCGTGLRMCGTGLRPVFSRVNDLRHTSPLHIGLQKTLRHCLYPRVLVHGAPSARRGVEFQHAVFSGRVRDLADELHAELAIAVARQRKPHRVAASYLGQARTFARIAQVAAVLQFVIGGLRAFVSRRRTLAAPSVTQRQPGRMRPERILDSRPREEVRTGHSSRHCNAVVSAQWSVVSCQRFEIQFV